MPKPLRCVSQYAFSYALVGFLFAFKIWRWKALPVLALPVGTWFSVIYLGEHYFVDVLAFGSPFRGTPAPFVWKKMGVSWIA